ncbi:acylphosphatase [Pseudonocardia pini]|uniref:acylphosphatase n=1 Tax=Pseudonocardia pini TaxID=2758030 RepID=UPI0015F03F5F|nr:acylphosphatase [Pseudonocardia pini]
MRSNDEATVRLNAWVSGQVQGVGFRWWTRARALELGLVGEARNLPDGRVAVAAQGERAACERLLVLLRGNDTPGRVDSVAKQWVAPTGVWTAFVER